MHREGLQPRGRRHDESFLLALLLRLGLPLGHVLELHVPPQPAHHDGASLLLAASLLGLGSMDLGGEGALFEPVVLCLAPRPLEPSTTLELLRLEPPREFVGELALERRAHQARLLRERLGARVHLGAEGALGERLLLVVPDELFAPD